jgi:hypothetical protein
LAGLVAGDRVAISPVRFRWIGRPVATLSQEGFGFGNANDFFQIKQINALGGAFADVSGPATAAAETVVDDKYRGLVFRGSDEDPATGAFPRANDQALVNSVQDDEPIELAYFSPEDGDLQGNYGIKGFSLSPGLEVICPDLDFRLLGVIVRGKMKGTATGRRSA